MKELHLIFSESAYDLKEDKKRLAGILQDAILEIHNIVQKAYNDIDED